MIRNKKNLEKNNCHNKKKTITLQPLTVPFRVFVLIPRHVPNKFGSAHGLMKTFTFGLSFSYHGIVQTSLTQPMA